MISIGFYKLNAIPVDQLMVSTALKGSRFLSCYQQNIF